jgi:hypothetical protein
MKCQISAMNAVQNGGHSAKLRRGDGKINFGRGRSPKPAKDLPFVRESAPEIPGIETQQALAVMDRLTIMRRTLVAGTPDHLRPEWLITITGMRNQAGGIKRPTSSSGQRSSMPRARYTSSPARHTSPCRPGMRMALDQITGSASAQPLRAE